MKNETKKDKQPRTLRGRFATIPKNGSDIGVVYERKVLDLSSGIPTSRIVVNKVEIPVPAPVLNTEASR